MRKRRTDFACNRRHALEAACIALFLTANLGGAHPILEDRIAALDAAIAVAPDDASLYLRRGDQYRIEGQPELALADYVRARDRDPELEGLELALGELRLATGSAAAALAHFDTCLVRRPNDPAALLGRARALTLAGRHDDAARAYARAVGTSGRHHPDIYLEWARALAAAGRRPDAIAVLERGLRELGPVTALHLAALDLDLAAADWDAALRRLSRLADDSPRRQLWLVQRAELLERLGRFDEARIQFLAVEASLAQADSGRSSTALSTRLAPRIAQGISRLDLLATIGR